MENKKNMFEEGIVDNIRKIMKEKNLTQATLAEYACTSESQFSKILNGKVHFSLQQIENIASKLSMREIDIMTYPKVFVEKEQAGEEPVEAILQIKLKKDKKDQVLKLIFGDNDIEILNK